MAESTVKNQTRNSYLNSEELRETSSLYLTDVQILLINEPTPESEIEYKEDSNGRKYKSVRAAYVKRRLNLIFGFGHSFEIIDKEHLIASNEVMVTGRLTVHSNGIKIIREQVGRHYMLNAAQRTKKTNGTVWKDLGNGFKSAATDCLKKCASEFGICWDVYDQEIPEAKSELLDGTQDLTQDQIKTHERLDYFLQKETTVKGVQKVYDKWAESGNETLDYTNTVITNHLNRVQ